MLGWWVNENFLYFLSNFAVNPKLFFILILFIWLHQVLVAACEILFPDQGLNLGLLHWELRVLATGPREKSPKLFFKIKSIQDFLCGPVAKIWPSYSGSVGSIPGQWAGTPHAWWPKNPTNIKQKQYCSKFSKDLKKNKVSVQFSSSRVWLFGTPWTTARPASLSITNCPSLPKSMSIESVIPSKHLILCRSLLLLPSIFPSIRDFTKESAVHNRWPRYWLTVMHKVI